MARDGMLAQDRDQSSATPAALPALRIDAVALLHWSFFAFAIASLLLLCLLVPQQTDRAPVILVGGFVFWCAGVAVRAVTLRDQEVLALEPAQLFVPVLIASYTVFAFDATPPITSFTPSSPDSMPGLHAPQHAYFAIVLCALSAFCGWYGLRRGRLLETMLAAQVVLLSVLYERSLSGGGVVPPLVLTAAAVTILRFAPLSGERRPLSQPTLRLALALGAFVLVAFAATAVGELPGASLNTTGKMLALAVFAVVLCDALREVRQRWLMWGALVVPAVAVAGLVVYQLADIAREMGVAYAIGNRLDLASGVEVNPVGLSFTLGILLIAGALPQMQAPLARWTALAAIALLLPALIVTYSVGSLLGLGSGLVVLAVLHLSRPRQEPRDRWRYLPAAMLAAVALVVVAAYTVPDHTRNGLRYTLEDPTTGRSRIDLWQASLRDFRANPLLGVGPNDYVPRARYVPGFPERDITRVLERRRLLGIDTTHWRFLFLGHPHNLVLDVAEGMGVAGLIALAGVVGVAGMAGVRVLRDRGAEDRWLTGTALAALVATAAWSMGSVGVQIALVPLPAWIVLAMLMSARAREPSTQCVAPRWLSRRALRISGGVALVLALVVFVVRPVGSMAYNAAARDRLASGDDAAAANAFRMAGIFDPLDIDSRAALSNIDLRRGDIDSAIAHTRDHAARTPRTGAIAVRLGELEWLRGDLEAAERYFRTGIAQDEWQMLNADPYTPLGLLLITRGDVEKGTAMIAAGLRVSPVNARDPAWVATTDGQFALDSAYTPGATAGEGSPLRRALERRLRLPSGGAASSPGDVTLSDVIALTEAAARTESDRERAAAILHQAGLAFQAAGDHREAARVLADAVAADPGASYARYDLAQSLTALGDDATAQAQLEEVVRIARAADTYDLRIGFAQRDLALLAMRADRYEDAVRLMRGALDDYRWAYLPLANGTLADAYQRLGDGERAAEWRRREAFLQGRD